MYINVHGHQIFAKCTLNECTKMELDPPQLRGGGDEGGVPDSMDNLVWHFADRIN